MCGSDFGKYINVFGDRLWLPNCEECGHYNRCYLQRKLQELSETIFNINREMAGRTDFVHNGKQLIKLQESEE